jgi:hypothetical protein
MVPALLGGVLGVAQGACHAFEPDHLAAVTTLAVSEKRPRQIVRLAAAWGLGHALVLLAVGGSLLLARADMPAPVADACELAVAGMLVLLGTKAIRRARNTRAHGAHPHAGDEARAHDDAHVHARAHPARAAVVGMVHGLAGSGALAALVVARSPSALEGLAFIALYGLGAALGMAGIAGAAGLPLSHVARSARLAWGMGLETGVLSVALGAAWAWPIARRWLG